jgi:dTDP-4-amino-4,6-dideoxygalactose transaminase
MTKLALHGGSPVRTDGTNAHWPPWDEREKQALADVIDSGTGQYGIGEHGVKLEQELADWMGCKYARCTINGTETMVMALKAGGIGPGDEVIIPAMTFIACPLAVWLTQAVPVLADVSPHNLALDPRDVEANITANTKAIMAVSLAGVPCDMDAMLDICRRHDLFLLEDVAQAQGSEWREKKLGTIGDIGSLSFHGAKTMTSGDGGAIVTDNKELADFCQSYRQFGGPFEGSEHDCTVVGGNYRMTEFAAAVSRVGLTKVNDLIDKRNESARILDEMLTDVPMVTPLQFPEQVTRRSYLAYTMHYNQEAADGIHRDIFLKATAAEGLRIGGIYNTTINHLPPLAGPLRERDRARVIGRHIDYPALTFPQADDIIRNTLMSVHQSWLLSDEQAVRDLGTAMQKVAENIGDLRDEVI